MSEENEQIEVAEGVADEQIVNDDPSPTETDQETPDGDPDDSVVVTIGDEPAQTEDEEVARAPEWVRELRKNHRESQRRVRELEEQLKTATGGAQKLEPLGKKPTLEDFDYDAEKFETALESWYDKKRRADEEDARIRTEQENQQKAWQAKLDAYHKAKGDLKVKDFDDAESAIQETFSTTQQGIIVQGAENPALVIYALGKNPAKAKELSAITDPVKYAFAVARLETQLKVTQRKPSTAPERTVRGTAPVSGSVDSALERLRADAERTGDYSKVIAYKNQQRQKAA